MASMFYESVRDSIIQSIMEAEHETLQIIKSHLREKGFVHLPLMNLEGTILSVWSTDNHPAWGPIIDLNDPNSIDDLENYLLSDWRKMTPIFSVFPLSNTD